MACCQQLDLALPRKLHYTKILKRAPWKLFRKQLRSIYVFIGLDTCCSAASCPRDWEAVGTSAETHAHTDTMEYENTKHKTGKQSSYKQAYSIGWGNSGLPTIRKFSDTRPDTHLVNRFLSTLGCWLRLQLLAFLGWSPLDLGRVELVHQLHGERGKMGPLGIYRQRGKQKVDKSVMGEKFSVNRNEIFHVNLPFWQMMNVHDSHCMYRCESTQVFPVYTKRDVEQSS